MRRRTHETVAVRLRNPSTACEDADKRKKREHRPSGPFTNSPQFDARRECLVSVRMSGDVAYGREIAGEISVARSRRQIILEERTLSADYLPLGATYKRCEPISS